MNLCKLPLYTWSVAHFGPNICSFECLHLKQGWFSLLSVLDKFNHVKTVGNTRKLDWNNLTCNTTVYHSKYILGVKFCSPFGVNNATYINSFVDSQETASTKDENSNPKIIHQFSFSCCQSRFCANCLGNNYWYFPNYLKFDL